MAEHRNPIIAFACTMVLTAAGCSQSSGTRPPTIPVDIGPTYVAPDGTGPRQIDGITYGYVATPEREAQIVAGFAELKLGQSREEVREALGLPDTAQPMYGKVGDESFHGWSYKYKIRIRDNNFANRNDVLVHVFFTPSGALEWAIADHIVGLTEIGPPTPGETRPLEAN